MALLATLTSPKPTTTKKPERTLGVFEKYLYMKYGITPPTTLPTRFITGPWYDDEHPLPGPTTSTTTPAPEKSNVTKSYLDFVLDKWLKEGHETRHSYTDVYGGLPPRPKDIPDYHTYFGHPHP